MKKEYGKYLILAIVILLIQTSIFAQTSPKIIIDGTGDKTLSYEDIPAYQNLLTTKIFTFALFYEDAQEFHSTTSLANLLQEKHAEKALQSVAKKANPEGQVYALIGLQVIESTSFKSLFEEFKKNLSEKKIDTISSEDGGCDSMRITLKKEEVIRKLELGEYGKYFAQRFKHIKFKQDNAQTTMTNEDSKTLKPVIEVKEFSNGLLKFLKEIKTPKDILPQNIERQIGIKDFGYDEKKGNQFFSRTAVVDHEYWSVNVTNMNQYFWEEDKNEYQLWFYFGYFRPVPEAQPSPTVPYPPPYISDETPGCKIDFSAFTKDLQKSGFRLSKEVKETHDNLTKWHIFKRGKTKVGIYVQTIPSKKSQNTSPVVTPGKDGKPTIIDFKPDKNEISTCISTVSIGVAK